MNKSMAKHFMMTVIFFGFTLLGSTELLAVDHDGFHPQPAKKPLNKKTEKKSSDTKAQAADDHYHDGVQKPKKSTQKTELHKDAATEKHHDLHHDHDGIQKPPKAFK